MAKAKTQEEVRQDNVVATVSASQKFYDENKKTIWTVICAVLVVALGILAYVKLVYQPACEEAKQQTYPAEENFRNGEYGLALEGDGNVLGFAEICSTYGAKAGKAVYFYAGVCSYMNGAYEDAVEYLSKYKTEDVIMSGRATALLGDSYAALENYSKAVKCYAKAASVDNVFAAGYLFKEGRTWQELGNEAKAQACFLKIQDKYPQSIEAYDIEKYIR